MRRARIPRLTIRARLTLIYGGSLLLAGIVLLGITYLLVSQQLPGNFVVSGTKVDSSAPPVATSPPPPEAGPVTEFQTFARKVAHDTRNDALRSLLTQGGIALSIVVVVAGAFGWLLAGRALQPLQRVTETARRIANAPAADRGLHERIGLDGPDDEIKDLADTFDVMLERLDHSFDGQRRFIANASHELRTPLTLNRALLEVAVHRNGASPEVRHLAETLLEINARHERLIDGLLTLVRSEATVTERSYVDLADVVEHVVGQLPPGPVAVRAQTEEAATTGSSVLLERLVQNLVENGVRHNVAEGGWVRVTTGTRPDGTAFLAVSNTGPVVPRYEIPGLFEPFRRLGTDRLATSPGAGLGLSIVLAVARAHGGDVHAEPRDGGGLVVTVTLPGSNPGR
ncbi:MAG: HAMP domain-containing histidine kinase [Micromonosporaceae bacterium]|nr:HAMP domain-containing histidine kinase [Micromonosporaceae bacterium]